MRLVRYQQFILVVIGLVECLDDAAILCCFKDRSHSKGVSGLALEGEPIRPLRFRVEFFDCLE